MENIKKFLNENQDPAAVEKAIKNISTLLTKDEEVLYVAVQKKPVQISPESIALTTKRLIFLRPKNFGLSMNFHDYLWKEIKDCHMSEGILGATFKMLTIKGGQLTIDYLPKEQARILYRYAQEREEEMDEYRRQRDLESARASAGGVVIQNDQKEKPAEMNSKENAMQKLKDLKEMLDHDLITQEEYDSKKREILDKI